MGTRIWCNSNDEWFKRKVWVPKDSDNNCYYISVRKYDPPISCFYGSLSGHGWGIMSWAILMGPLALPATSRFLKGSSPPTTERFADFLNSVSNTTRRGQRRKIKMWHPLFKIVPTNSGFMRYATHDTSIRFHNNIHTTRERWKESMVTTVYWYDNR